MRVFLTGICILSALVATGNSLTCEKCINLHGANCTGALVTCDAPESVCTATLRETSKGNQKTVVFEKACGRSKDCEQKNSILTAENFRVSLNTRCCASDHCNQGSLKGIPVNNTLNGQTCPSCFSLLNSNPCNEKATISCSGEETECIQLTALKKGNMIMLHGCATEQMSDSGGKAAFYGTSVQVISFSKSNGSIRLQSNLFLLALAGLLLMKLLS
ncbi:phospholipase A2 inhibitor and Ly6/PLAUR domain-containing protein-like [Rhinatrema bivittatum]|uniref:phospholipase A2 inhibitor and Ly6/PLAUR domain-containing protein-like n=1 Tax=Rhinatrema bivittatum TaxID=194408 RepID=UPI0011264EE0|nr:phospholipase A2 inhibitor and Ly6/PLAUR domain-containing protein-like [Rhinatrema bivittatum]XP_029433091.1 phospholipase A2 inhibitor and Ly6/PLAUR domain-containing protein-like [Rhinatrema bivittatum]